MYRSTCRWTLRSSGGPLRSKPNDSGLGEPPLLLFAFLFLVVRRAGPCGAEEELAAVWIGDISPIRAVAAVLGLVAGHHNGRTDFQSVPRDTASHQGVRGSAFDHPLFGRAVGFLHVDVDPGMRIDPLGLADRAFKFQGLVGV